MAQVAHLLVEEEVEYCLLEHQQLAESQWAMTTLTDLMSTVNLEAHIMFNQ